LGFLRFWSGSEPFHRRIGLDAVFMEYQILKKTGPSLPGTAEPQLRFDAPKTQTGIAELGLRGPGCCGLLIIHNPKRDGKSLNSAQSS